MPVRSQPGDHFYQIILRHRCATGRRPVDAAPDMKKDGASFSGHRRIGIVPDLDQPVIGEIARAHFFVTVIVGRILRINYNVTIVIRRTRIIAPNVCVGDLMIWIVATRWQVCVLPKDLSDRENSRGRTTVSFSFAKTWLVLSLKSCSPPGAILSPQ